jgi:NADH pyrophosphatase NudC (nudix superfamily)
MHERMAAAQPAPVRYAFCPCCAAELVDAQIDGERRQRCSRSCGYVDWGNPIPVVLAIVELDGKIILARQPGWPSDSFFLISGFVETGENYEQAILREISEEIGLTAVIESCVGSYPFVEMNQILTVFHVSAAGAVTLGPELAEVKFVEPSALLWWSRGAGPAVRDWILARETISKSGTGE